MKHTNYQTITDKAKSLEHEELKRAMIAHGGFYAWSEENGDCPLIAINPDGSAPEPQDIEVTQIALIGGRLEFSGVDKQYGVPVDFRLEDIFSDQISTIIDCIPATDSVSDVSIPIPGNLCKPKLGDKVWVFNMDRRDKARDRYGEITKVGKKYFYVKTGIHSEERFYIETLQHDGGECSPYLELYPSQEACEYHKEAEEKKRAISNRLFRFLTDEEACELYDTLTARDI